MAREMAQWVPDPTHDIKAVTKDKLGFMEWHLNLTSRDCAGRVHGPRGNSQLPPECLSSESPAVASFTPVPSPVSNSEVGYCTRKYSAGQKDFLCTFTLSHSEGHSGLLRLRQPFLIDTQEQRTCIAYSSKVCARQLSCALLLRYWVHEESG